MPLITLRKLLAVYSTLKNKSIPFFKNQQLFYFELFRVFAFQYYQNECEKLWNSHDAISHLLSATTELELGRLIALSLCEISLVLNVLKLNKCILISFSVLCLAPKSQQFHTKSDHILTKLSSFLVNVFFSPPRDGCFECIDKVPIIVSVFVWPDEEISTMLNTTTRSSVASVNYRPWASYRLCFKES